ncbi:hypothetical protein HK105_206321 [Polyrhizophydium stewartii]|uniref:Uncharacterized protein n=1 Tax=Polyrhizophydium stewartii TaxID=2732419 RepID=A0ABR4N409_9FUNG|nr:hypothetical protein HK105_006039 [Polyrhizophydium stewartii]
MPGQSAAHDNAVQLLLNNKVGATTDRAAGQQSLPGFWLDSKTLVPPMDELISKTRAIVDGSLQGKGAEIARRGCMVMHRCHIVADVAMARFIHFSIIKK